MPDAADVALYEQGLACPIWRGYYSIQPMTGQVEVRNDPPQAIFEQAWAYLNTLDDNMPRILGNMLAHSQARWGEMYTDDLMQRSGRKYFTLTQYKSTYGRIPKDVQDAHPGAKHTYCRIVSGLAKDNEPDAERQDAVLTRIEAGEFDEPDPNYPKLDTKEKRIRRIVNMLKGQPTPKPERPMLCPVCGGNGWTRADLHKPECPRCGMHGDELLTRLDELTACVREFYTTGHRTPLDNFVRTYKIAQEAQ